MDKLSHVKQFEIKISLVGLFVFNSIKKIILWFTLKMKEKK